MQDETVKAEIESYGLSIEDLAASLGITRQAVYKWHKIPRYARAYLNQYVRSRDCMREIERVKAREAMLREAVKDVVSDSVNKVIDEKLGEDNGR